MSSVSPAKLPASTLITTATTTAPGIGRKTGVSSRQKKRAERYQRGQCGSAKRPSRCSSPTRIRSSANSDSKMTYGTATVVTRDSRRLRSQVKERER